MKRTALVVLLFSLIAGMCDAQLWKLKRWEAEFGIGPSFFFPDVGGFSIGKNLAGLKDMGYRQTRFDINGSLRYRLSRTANLRLSMTYAMLHASDKRGSNENRNYESTTNLFEPALVGEYYFIKNKYESSYLFIKGKGIQALLRSLDFYVFGGAGGAWYSVKVNEALSARNMPTSGLAPVIPAGLGATLIYTPNLNFGLELGGRYVFSDYIDGYHSQFSKANDVYYLMNVNITYKLKSGARGLPTLR
ncbi:MAG TPA: hypothetical protein PKL65_12535 [Bacteroidales bacterium]|nr:hypothetical protein [Bacteroidales bacterium]HNR43051.1 hypothetical protein [Bacteroidales bacterium]HPM18322.1 hypothetical protein [Bacteroidales bacterium]